ncbi:multidrug and toxin extrusion protein 1-like [Liolophura sinensis]|uniref:multidrug and toxin extrusion protein 1-like n=1 Tax=Liolophura sinensis TaxID=3198878 RepID=UPI0031593491
MATNQDGTTSGVVSDAHGEDKTTRGDCPPNSGGNWVNPDKPSLIQKCFPTGLKEELKQLIKISWPIALTSFFTFSFTPIALIFCGHLGKEELDAAALATSVSLQFWGNGGDRSSGDRSGSDR